jgi:HD-GYP domain-containing protein (c-di-GMP phosphodiesterase class II)
MDFHSDILQDLNRNLPLAEKLRSIHDVVNRELDFIDRIAVALYDTGTDSLKTFMHSSKGDNPLEFYEARLSAAPSLQRIMESGQPRVIQDLSVIEDRSREHTQRIAEQGYLSSYTLPMYENGQFLGFLFFNSYNSDQFSEPVLHKLDLFGHLISLTIMNELTSIRTLLASVKAARHVTHHRDVETGAHINRTAHYARLIARELALKYNFDDELIERIFLFSPLHDIGKIAIPDSILHKPGPLDEDELEIMRTHAEKGREIVDALLADFGLSGVEHTMILRNIAQYHHEAVDGSGYPEGLQGARIPIEARISAVADVFDALTSKRPYKEAWSNDRAFANLGRLAGSKLDRDCVTALLENREKVEEIQRKFKDEPYD